MVATSSCNGYHIEAKILDNFLPPAIACYVHVRLQPMVAAMNTSIDVYEVLHE